MKIKAIEAKPTRRVNITEWNDEIEAFFKPLTMTERLLFNDLYRDYVDREAAPGDRARAGVDAAILCLVDAEGKPVFTDADADAIYAASYIPVSRVFYLGLDPDAVDKSFKKN